MSRKYQILSLKISYTLLIKFEFLSQILINLAIIVVDNILFGTIIGGIYV